MADATVKSCLSCPSYLGPADAAAFFGKSVGAPVCARFGHILERPNSTNAQNKDTVEKFAKGCSEYGAGRPARKPEIVRHEVFLPNPDHMVELPELDTKRTLVRTCGQCTHFVSDPVVEEEHGWAAGACQAKGKLIPGNRKTIEARGCTYRAAGPQESTINLMLLPIYRSVDAAREAKLARAADSITEPLDYETDRELTDGDIEAGIQAWREVVDQGGSTNSVFLPVFDPKSFTEEQRDWIPKTGDDEHPELYFDHNNATYLIGALWTELDETPALWGQPGVGKTEIFRHLAWLMQVPFYRFSIKESTELYELEGSQQFDDKRGTWFRDGRFTVAWQSKCVIVVDEPNLGRPEVWAFLRPCMDNSKQLVIDADGGRMVKRDGFAFMGLAMNPSWSPLNIGTSPIGAADASRLMHMEFAAPEEAVERKIIENRIRLDGWIIDKQRLDFVISISDKIRELCGQGHLAMSWGPRENIKVARALRWFEPLTAYRMAAADYLEPEQRESVLDQVRASSPSVRFPAPTPVES